MRTTHNAYTSALISLLGNIAVRGFDAVPARSDESGAATLNFYAVISFKRIVGTSHEKSQIFDLQIVLGMNTVIVLGNYRQFTLAANFKVNVGMNCARIQSFIGCIDCRARVVNIVFRVLLCFNRNLVTADNSNGIYRIRNKRESLKLQIKFISVADVNYNVSFKPTRNRVDGFFTDSSKGQRCSFELVCLICSRNTLYRYIYGFAIKISVVRAKTVKRFAKALIILSESLKRSGLTRYSLLGSVGAAVTVRSALYSRFVAVGVAAIILPALHF